MSDLSPLPDTPLGLYRHISDIRCRELATL